MKVARLFPTLFVLALGAVPVLAQVNLARWGRPGHPLRHALQATQPALGGAGVDLHLEFPLYNRALPNRAQLQAVLVYDSEFWGSSNGAWTPAPGAGWWLRTSGGQLTEDEVDGACGYHAEGSESTYTFNFQEPDGTVVPDAAQYIWTDGTEGCPNSTNLPMTFNIGDGKGFEVVIDAYGDGTAWDGYGDNVTSGLADPNGNSMSVTATALSDALGSVVTIAGSGTPSSPRTFSYTGPNSTQETVTVYYESVYASTNFGCYSGWSGYLNVPEEIAYPDGSTYKFTYGPHGFLNS